MNHQLHFVTKYKRAQNIPLGCKKSSVLMLSSPPTAQEEISSRIHLLLGITNLYGAAHKVSPTAQQQNELEENIEKASKSATTR